LKGLYYDARSEKHQIIIHISLHYILLRVSTHVGAIFREFRI